MIECKRFSKGLYYNKKMVGLSSKSLYTSQRIFLLINDSKIIHPEFKKDNAIDLSSNGMFANIFETVEFLD